jgi:predicted AAA+ superfamily ATPase
MIERKAQLAAILSLLDRNPVVGLIGARQVGKTTVARLIADDWQGETTFLDLEDPEDLARLGDPMLALKPLKGLVVLDEIQRLPGLFEVIRVLADRPRAGVRFLVLGSASPDLLRQSSETLAGRISYHRLGGFSLGEVGAKNQQRLWLRGGFPRSYLAQTNSDGSEWRRDFIQTFLERDIPNLGINIRPLALRRFWTMLAHYHGQIWNASEFARSFGVADTTVRGYLDILTSSFVVRQLPAWYENLSKRQVKAPKVYLTDSGILHTLLNLQTQEEIESHPKLGASWEGFVMGELIHHLGVREEECFFWATHSGAELDLLVVRGNRKIGFEIKRTSSPKVTKSIRNAREDLKLDRVDVIHAGEQTFPLAEGIRAVAFGDLKAEVRGF